MLTLEECKKVLNKKEQKYTDDQVKQIRSFIMLMAEIHLQNQKLNK